ncbi:MAG: GDP-4-dehydro-6-deoxy-D-mannose reductase [Myxococcaceae bacterium]|nr:GDP-4-dehydro-6-deoxy-D-mannose reductase [Myxococcaceae bacterium]
MRVLVTGADGFVGKHLSRTLRARGDEVLELCGPHLDPPPAGAVRVDLTNAADVRGALEGRAFDSAVHLAGASSVARSHEHPAEAYAINAVGTVNLLAAVRASSPAARVLVVGSGEVYGAPSGAAPSVESDVLAPLSPYAGSKVAVEIAALQFHRSYGLATIVARPFNHLGRGQAPQFVVPSFARQIVRVRTGAIEPRIAIGNLSPVRDFSHVLDVIDAYCILLACGVPGEAYNVGSSVGRTIRSVLDELLLLADVAAEVEVDPARLRPAEIPSLVGDATKLRALGWAPTRSVTDALRDVLAEAEEELSS